MEHKRVKHADANEVVPLWLDGEQTCTATTFEITNPSTGRAIYHSSSASAEDATAAITSAEAAFESWSKTKPNVRRDILLRVAEGLQKRKSELYQIVHSETGAAESMFDFEFNLTVEACKTVAGLISAVRGIVPTPIEPGKSAMILREPYGVVLSVAPWNAPYILGFRSCLGPLAMGNTVVLKGSESSPKVYWAIASLLHEAGLPKGCLNTVIHRPQDAAQITSLIIAHPAVKKITFTGSTNVGAIIASQAGRLLKPTLMELGGKAPTIVCEDADILEAAQGCAFGAFLHAGQICMSTERIIVHEKIVQQFKAALNPVLDQVFGYPDGLILVNGTPVEKNKKLLEDAVRKGAKVVYGDIEDSLEVKAAMRPVVLENIRKGMELYHTESFGPTVSLFTVQSDDEAISLANDTEYGLSSSIYTRDLRRGFGLAKRIQAGAVHINSMTVHDESALPHGGVKKSGSGRFNSIEGLEEWVQTKTVTWRD